jgi:hypothetical protein
MDVPLRNNLFLAKSGEPETPGLVHAFVPAHGSTQSGAVTKEVCRTLSEDCGVSVLLADFYSRGFPVWGSTEAPQRFEGQLKAYVTAGPAYDSLEARDVNSSEVGKLLRQARRRYQIACADLSAAREVVTLEVLRHADSIFLVSESDEASLEVLRYKATWLRLMEMEENAGLLLLRVPGGASAVEAEDRVGLPVCAVVDRPEEIARLSRWLASPFGPRLSKAALAS